jgi:hypothetical protein
MAKSKDKPVTADEFAAMAKAPDAEPQVEETATATIDAPAPPQPESEPERPTTMEDVPYPKVPDPVLKPDADPLTVEAMLLLDRCVCGNLFNPWSSDVIFQAGELVKKLKAQVYQS